MSSELPEQVGETETPVKPELPEPFVQLMRTGWADPVEDHLVPISGAAAHAGRRAALSAQFPGETLVIPTGPLKVRSNDTDYDFRPGTDFAYLTGHYEPDAVLVLQPRGKGHQATVYLQPRSSRENDDFFKRGNGELWVGRRHTLSGYQTLLGVDCADIDTLEKALPELDGQTTRIRRGIDLTVDAAFPVTEETEKRDQELVTALAEARLVKDPWEIDQLSEAIAATIRGFEDIVRAVPADRECSERLIDGIFAARARHDGNWVGYGTIAAAGAHACTLHWVRNDGTVHPGELLLVDAGVENQHFYTADITRTLPVSGAFSDTQRQLYEIVYAAQQAGFATIRPGVAWQDVHLACMRILANGLAELGILTIPVEEALDKDNQTYRRWTLHGFGHMLGIDVHDCEGAREENYHKGIIKAGEVFTVEPGLYFQPDDLLVPEKYRGIGIRIEDDVLVTETGYEVLSAALPSHPDEVERWMAELRRTPYLPPQ